jgi:hypothetical protein
VQRRALLSQNATENLSQFVGFDRPCTTAAQSWMRDQDIAQIYGVDATVQW